MLDPALGLHGVSYYGFDPSTGADGPDGAQVIGLAIAFGHRDEPQRKYPDGRLPM